MIYLKLQIFEPLAAYSLMKAVSSTAAPLPPAIIKMEDRKRPAGQSVDELAPPTKRQAVNGGSKVSVDADMPWKDELEAFQKDAIYRQMLEYKREKATLESELRDIRKRAVNHDDHLRVVDAWWSQLLDEVTLLAKGQTTKSFSMENPFPTALSFKNSTEFSDHLESKSKQIKGRVNEILASVASSTGRPSTELHDLRDSLAKLLASQKEEMIKLDRLRVEKEDLEERLQSASLRMVKTEKKLERMKSAAVARLDQRGLLGTGTSPGNGNSGMENGFDTRSEAVNGIQDDDGKAEAAQLAYKEASVITAKQKEQIESLLSENKVLTEQLTTASSRLASLTDDDYARTELFKNFKIQHEDVIKRINHLEATNIQLREEAEKLQAERTAYRTQIQDEADAMVGEIESQLQQVEANLTRVRSTRDELFADQTMRKESQDQERTATRHMKELVSAKDNRIESLESEIQRLRSQHEGESCEPTPRPEVDELSVEELRRKYISLEESFASVNNELPAMEKAYKKSMALSSKKVMDFAALEEKVGMLIAEKSKADQKYFAARKDMEMRIGEVRSLRVQNAKSSEIIAQLKDVESSNRVLLTNLEKQLSDMRQAHSSIMASNKTLEMSNSDTASKLEGLRYQVSELSNLLKTKDGAYSNIKQRAQSLETDLEQLRTRFEQVQKEKETWKTKSLSNQTGEEEMLRTLALCTVCRIYFKDTVLKTCGHLFCKNCVEDRITNRLRKCPNCGKGFDKMDVMAVHM